MDKRALRYDDPKDANFILGFALKRTHTDLAMALAAVLRYHLFFKLARRLSISTCLSRRRWDGL
jgi:hypothetical protein